MKFLIIDDNPDMRKIIIRQICKEYDVCEECDDGINAEAVYSNFQPDYVLMDIQMRDMDGLTATKIIINKYPAARIIIVTDYDTPAFRVAAKKAGACGFVSKENLSDVREFINCDAIDISQK